MNTQSITDLVQNYLIVVRNLVHLMQCIENELEISNLLPDGGKEQ